MYIDAPNVWVYGSRFIANTANSSNNDRGSAVYIAKNMLFHMRDGVLDKNYVYGGNNSNFYYGDISFSNINPDVVGTVLGNSVYQQYISNSSSFRYAVAYVTNGPIKGLGFSADSATSLSNVYDTGVEDNIVIYIVDQDYALDNIQILTKNVTIIGINNTIIRPGYQDKKSLFILQDGSVVTMSNLTLEGGIEVQKDATLNINDANITGAQTGINSNGTVTVNNVNFYGNDRAINAGKGTLTVKNSTFTNNHNIEYRNIKVENGVNAEIIDNTFDANLTDIIIDNKVYGNNATVTGKFDAGVNIEISGITFKVESTKYSVKNIEVGKDGNFTFDLKDDGILKAGTYNVTADNGSATNKFTMTNVNSFEIVKANVSANTVDE